MAKSGAGGEEHVKPEFKGYGSSRWVWKSMPSRWSRQKEKIMVNIFCCRF